MCLGEEENLERSLAIDNEMDGTAVPTNQRTEFLLAMGVLVACDAIDKSTLGEMNPAAVVATKPTVIRVRRSDSVRFREGDSERFPANGVS
jgi:hypothetical protein